jgi:alcohol dehydrogenase, propanol-preferring
MTLNNRNHIYRPVEATSDGESVRVEREVVLPGPGAARIGVEACGACHGDVVGVTNLRALS